MKTAIRVQFQRILKWLKPIQIIWKHEATERLEFDMESMMPSTSTKNDQNISFIGMGLDAKPQNKIETDWKELKKVKNFKIQSGMCPRYEMLFSLYAQELHSLQSDNKIEENE